MSIPQQNSSEVTPVDDTRRVRERLDREANGDIRILAQRARAAAEKYRDALGLRFVPASEPQTPATDESHSL